MVLRRETDVFHARVLHKIEPFLRIVFHGIELVFVDDIVFAEHVAAPMHLLLPAGHGIDAPMHEHAETLLEEPVATVAETLNHHLLFLLFS